MEKLKRSFDLAVEWVHFPLHPETPAEGLSLEALFGADPEARRARQARMKSLMDAEGLPYGDRSHTYNSRLAQELGAWAARQAGGEAIHLALFQAYFAGGRNIGEVETLVEIAKSAGLRQDEARRVITERTCREAVERDWTESRRLGVTGVPTFATAGYAVVGAQPYEVLEQLIVAAGARRRNGV
ncbi:MAG: DsbA family protein [Burkholderiales bacterium]|nr:DsbA family protein [Burkholderiales bacterium]